jgi:hypothetical protein
MGDPLWRNRNRITGISGRLWGTIKEESTKEN